MKNLILQKNSLSDRKTLRILFTVVIVFIAIASINAQIIPHEISYQGKLLESGNPFTGTKTITFTIGTWTETHLDVPINNGLYSVKLGSSNPIPAEIFDNNPTATLIIEIDGSTLSPFTDIVSVGYAFKSLYADTAHNAEKLGGQTSTYYQMGISNNSNSINNHISNYSNPHYVWKDDVGLENVLNINIEEGFELNEGKYISSDIIKARNTANGLKLLDYNNTGIIIKSGNVGIGISQTPSERLELNGNIKANAYYDRDDPSYYLNFNSTNNSLLVNGKVGVGTTSPSYKLDVIGDINFTGNIFQNGYPFTGANLWTESGLNIYRSNGNVGIGDSNPSEKLVVDGNIDVKSYLFFDKESHSTKIFRSGYNLYIEAPNGKLRLDNGTLTIDCQNDYIGFGTTSPQLPFHVQTSAGFYGSTGFAEYIKHINDENTYIRFIDNEIIMAADGINSINTFSIKNGTDSWIGLYPTTHKKGNIGEYNQAWYSMHSQYYYTVSTKNLQIYSDLKQNKNIKPLQNAYLKIKDLNVVSFNLKETVSNDKSKQYGLVAQEVKKVLPEIVQYNKNSDLYSIGYLSLVPILIKVVQEQQQQIEDLKTEIIKIKSNSN